MTAYRFQDAQSDKFWRIECLGADLMIQYGKTGTVGKYQIKSFEADLICQKQAEKLTAAKQKKGYLPFAEFDETAQLYIDDVETNLHRLTSHPYFREHFSDDFYYDCGDEEAPFGNDAGSDTLSNLSEAARRKKSLSFVDFPQQLIERDWGMTYISADDVSPERTRLWLAEDDMNLVQSDQVTCAVAFGQIKLTGKLDARLQQRALNALARLQQVAAIQQWGDGTPSPTVAKMTDDLRRFAAE